LSNKKLRFLDSNQSNYEFGFCHHFDDPSQAQDRAASERYRRISLSRTIELLHFVQDDSQDLVELALNEAAIQLSPTICRH
jgi:hypothetical protein